MTTFSESWKKRKILPLSQFPKQVDDSPAASLWYLFWTYLHFISMFRWFRKIVRAVEPPPHNLYLISRFYCLALMTIRMHESYTYILFRTRPFGTTHPKGTFWILFSPNMLKQPCRLIFFFLSLFQQKYWFSNIFADGFEQIV